jgi:hypothetical protein
LRLQPARETRLSIADAARRPWGAHYLADALGGDAELGARLAVRDAGRDPGRDGTVAGFVFGISGFWVGGLLRESPQAARRRQPVTRHRVAGSREITGMAMADTP